ncbi:helix-turn-helix domain-containing protein [Streptomyces sp. NPDC001288]
MPKKRPGRRAAVPDEEIVERYQRGEPVTKIAASYGVSGAVVERRVRERGVFVPRRPTGMTDEQKRQIVALYREGLSPNAVASRLGISRTTVRKAVNEAGARRTAPQDLVLQELQSDTMREIWVRHQAGASVDSLARQHGIARSTLQRRIARLKQGNGTCDVG